MSNADWDDQLRADEEEQKSAPKVNEPPNHDGERDRALPASLVPPPFGENEPPFTD